MLMAETASDDSGEWFPADPAPLPWCGWSLRISPGRVLPLADPEPRRAPCRRPPRRVPVQSHQRQIPWPVPLAPEWLAAEVVDAQVKLAWRASGAADSYVVRRADIPGGTMEVLASGVRASKGTNQTTRRGRVYFYVVSAVNAAGEGPPSSELPVYVPTAVEEIAALEQVPENETTRERARRLARIELARLELQRPWGGQPRKAKSLFAQQKLSVPEIEMGRLLAEDDIPKRSYPGCVEDPSPCWMARCRHNLLVEINRFSSLKTNFPGWDVDEHPATCSIKEARKGPQTVETVASLFGLTDEALRTIEQDGWRKVMRLIDPQRLWRGRRKEKES